MKSQQENNLIKRLKHIDLPNKLAAVAGIVTIVTAISISAFSQQQPDAVDFKEPTYPYHGNTNQNPSGITTTPSKAIQAAKSGLTTPPNVPKTAALNQRHSTMGFNRAITISEPPALYSEALTAVDSITPFDSTTPSGITSPSSTTVPYQSSSLPSSTISPSGISTTNKQINLLASATVPSSSNTPRRAIASSTTTKPLLPTSIPSNTPIRAIASSSAVTTPSRTISSFKLASTSIRPVRQTLVAANSSSIKGASSLEQAINDANAAAFGLVVAKREGQISPHTTTWRKAQSAIFLLRHGKSRQEAARRAGIPISMLVQLIGWGQNRP